MSFGMSAPAFCCTNDKAPAAVSYTHLHRDTGGVAGADNGLGDFDVLLKHMVRAVDHDGGVAGTECLHGQLIACLLYTSPLRGC